MAMRRRAVSLAVSILLCIDVRASADAPLDGAPAENGTCSGAAGVCKTGGVAGEKSLTVETMPRRIVDAEYAVRGEIVTRAFKIEEMLAQGNHSLPFDEVVPCNIGNPQAVGADPLTFHRQVLSLLSNPQILNEQAVSDLYPSDVIERAREYTAGFPKFGAYSHSKGVPLFRKKVAEYIDRRDGSGVPRADVEEIFLTDGASAGVKTVLETMIADLQDGVLIPIPQYPLYSASITRLGGTALGYEMVEDYVSGVGWGIDLAAIEQKIRDFLAGGGRVRAIAVINPGNPVGNVMSKEEVEAVVKLCAKYRIVVLADEVYQDNVWNPNKTFVSFRRVVLESQSSVELFSFHSMSKGYYGECGLRGGVLHLTNIDPAVGDQIYKLFSMTLCSNTLGQAMMASILNPPTPGGPSHEIFETERNRILAQLRQKADLVHAELNMMDGVQCLPVEGAMYAFPQVSLPRRFVAEAQAEGRQPDMAYCIKMLEATGVIVVPGSGFGQRPGTWHYRMTILPEEGKLRRVLKRMRRFHSEFLNTYLEPGEKVVEDKTPTPCLPKYDRSIQEEVIDKHLMHAPHGHAVPEMILMLGGSGAGKGTFLRAMQSAGLTLHHFVMHGLDEYLTYLPEYKGSTMQERVVFKDAADGCYSGAIPIAKAAQQKLIENRQHVVYEDTGKDLKRIVERVLPPFEKAGYRISVVLVDNLPAVAKLRAPQRFMREGRYSSDAYIDSTYRNVPENYAKLREMPQVKESVYCDNSCSGRAEGDSPKEGGCLKCWLDKGGQSKVFPAEALSTGEPVRLSAASR